VGAQAYTTDKDIGLYTTEASWLAVRLCQKFETPAEHEETYPQFSPGMRDWIGSVLAPTVKRAHTSLPVRYAEWRENIDPKDWQSYRSKDVFGRCDWLSARRFIGRCARRDLQIELSY
jgi:hypothetical protein